MIPLGITADQVSDALQLAAQLIVFAIFFGMLFTSIVWMWLTASRKSGHRW